MAFSRTSLNKVVEGSIAEAVNAVPGTDSTTSSSGQRVTLWLYAEIGTALGDIDAAAYFAAVGSTSGTGELHAGDLMWVVGSDGGNLYRVANAAAAAAGTIVALI